MQDLIIVGASGFGREVLQWAKDYIKINNNWNIKGFIDDDSSALDSYTCDCGILGKISDWNPSSNEVFALALANPSLKEEISTLLIKRGAKFATIIHPTAIVSDFTEIGEGVIITPRCKISPNVSIGKFATILGCSVGHDAKIGDYATLCGYSAICGHAEIGAKAFIGTSAVIAPSKKVGENAYVAMGSMVISNVKDGCRVMGNPAKKLKL